MLIVLLVCLIWSQFILKCYLVLFLMIRRPPRSTRTDTLFPSRRSSDLFLQDLRLRVGVVGAAVAEDDDGGLLVDRVQPAVAEVLERLAIVGDRKSTRLNSSH